jgi:AcrR family transcriptional regulator
MRDMARTRETTEVRQKQIVSAARRLIVKYGSEHVTVRRIALEAKVSEGDIYRHFKSKRDILSLLVDDIEKTLASDVESARALGLGSLETLERIIAGVQRRKGVSFQVIAEIISFGDNRLNKKVHDVINGYISCVRSVLAQGVAAGEIRSDIDLDSAATMFFGMTQGLVSMWALSRYSFDLKARFESLFTLFRYSVANVSSSSQPSLRHQ